jgi:hypothetical protein
VPRKEGEALAKKLGTLFIETSAKTTTGVQDAFVEVVRKVMRNNVFESLPPHILDCGYAAAVAPLVSLSEAGHAHTLRSR